MARFLLIRATAIAKGGQSQNFSCGGRGSLGVPRRRRSSRLLSISVIIIKLRQKFIGGRKQKRLINCLSFSNMAWSSRDAQSPVSDESRPSTCICNYGTLCERHTKTIPKTITVSILSNEIHKSKKTSTNHSFTLTTQYIMSLQSPKGRKEGAVKNRTNNAEETWEDK